MPIYEYLCEDCGGKSQFLTLAVGAALDLKCPKCGGTKLRKLVSRVAILRSDESRLDDMGGEMDEDFEAGADGVVEGFKEGSEGGEGVSPDDAGEDE